MRRSPDRDIKLVARAERTKLALILRREGLSYEEVGHKIGVTKATAFKMVKAQIRAIPKEEADAVRIIELERLDAMLMPLFKLAKKGNVAAVDRVLRIMERRASMLGLDAPRKAEITGVDGGPIELSAPGERLDRILDRIGAEAGPSDDPSADSAK